jgi:hypothetical protein
VFVIPIVKRAVPPLTIELGTKDLESRGTEGDTGSTSATVHVPVAGQPGLEFWTDAGGVMDAVFVTEVCARARRGMTMTTIMRHTKNQIQSAFEPRLFAASSAFGCSGFTLWCELMQSNLVYLKKLICHRRSATPPVIDAQRHFSHAFQ